MTARSRTCRGCGHTWPQRHARYCGWCGAPLGEASEPPPRRARSATTIATRALAAVGLIGLAVVVMSLDLTRPDAGPTVELDDAELEPAPSPLSPDERASLRAQADTGRLRCEPRGCELWRIEFGRTTTATSDVVALDNGLVVLTRDAERDAVELVALDPATGEPAWMTTLATEPPPPGRPTPWAAVLPGPHGLLVLSGQRLVAVDQDGQLVWDWSLSELDDAGGELWRFVEFDEVLVLEAVLDAPDRRTQQAVVALDLDDAAVRWFRIGGWSVLASDLVVTVDDDGHLERLDPRTGAPLWRGPQLSEPRVVQDVGGWLVVRDEKGGNRFIDAQTGRSLEGFDGFMLNMPVEVGDGAVAVVSDQPLEELGAAPPDLAVVHLGADGSLRWRTEIEDLEIAWSCCGMQVDDDEGTVTVSFNREARVLDVETGTILEVTELDDPGLSAGGVYVYEPRPGLEVAMEGGDLELRTDDGSIVVRSDDPVELLSDDPLIVRDRHHVMGLRVPVPG